MRCPPFGPEATRLFTKIMFNSTTVDLSLSSQEWRAPAQGFLPARLPAWREASKVWGELTDLYEYATHSCWVSSAHRTRSKSALATALCAAALVDEYPGTPYRNSVPQWILTSALLFRIFSDMYVSHYLTSYKIHNIEPTWTWWLLPDRMALSIGYLTSSPQYIPSSLSAIDGSRYTSSACSPACSPSLSSPQVQSPPVIDDIQHIKKIVDI